MARTDSSTAANRTGPYSYIVSTDGTTVFALNTTTGKVQFSGTDAGPVFRSIFTALATLTAGSVYVKRGTYNINTLVQEAGGSYHPYYGIVIPTSQSTAFNVMNDYKLIGEDAWHTIIKITSTGVTSAGASTNTAIGIWHQYTAGTGTFSNLELRGLRVQMPENQRGNTPPGMDRAGSPPGSGAIVDPAGMLTR
jgi:hypothetical protein